MGPPRFGHWLLKNAQLRFAATSKAKIVFNSCVCACWKSLLITFSLPFPIQMKQKDCTSTLYESETNCRADFTMLVVFDENPNSARASNVLDMHLAIACPIVSKPAPCITWRMTCRSCWLILVSSGSACTILSTSGCWRRVIKGIKQDFPLSDIRKDFATCLTCPSRSWRRWSRAISTFFSLLRRIVSPTEAKFWTTLIVRK